MRRLAATIMALGLLFAPAWWSAAAPAKHWREVRSAAGGFDVLFPGKPKVSAEPVASVRGAVLHSWSLAVGDHEAYEVAVTIYPGGTFPPPTLAFYDKLLPGYASVSQTHLRARRMITISGHPAVEAIFDTDHDFHHLVDVLVVGNRLYSVSSGGRGAHERDPDALKFHRSFRLFGD